MKRCAAALVLAVAFCVPGLAWAAEILLVVVLPDQPHVTTFLAVPADFPAEKLRELSSQLPAGGYTIDWALFTKDPETHVAERILKNEYEDYRTAEGLVELLRRYPGSAFGLTWNGGLALTGNDYRFARITHQRYLQDRSYVARPADRSADPVHPGNHIEPLLRR